jgi:hypothetical protein
MKSERKRNEIDMNDETATGHLLINQSSLRVGFNLIYHRRNQFKDKANNIQETILNTDNKGSLILWH